MRTNLATRPPLTEARIQRVLAAGGMIVLNAEGAVLHQRRDARSRALGRVARHVFARLQEEASLVPLAGEPGRFVQAPGGPGPTRYTPHVRPQSLHREPVTPDRSALSAFLAAHAPESRRWIHLTAAHFRSDFETAARLEKSVIRLRGPAPASPADAAAARLKAGEVSAGASAVRLLERVVLGKVSLSLLKRDTQLSEAALCAELTRAFEAFASVYRIKSPPH